MENSFSADPSLLPKNKFIATHVSKLLGASKESQRMNGLELLKFLLTVLDNMCQISFWDVVV